MNKRVLFLLLCVGLTGIDLRGEIICESRECKIKVDQVNSQLVLRSAISDFDGTLKLTDNAADRIQGENVTFNNGVLETSTLVARYTGVYDPTGTDILRLTGSHLLRCNAGTVLPSISVSGAANRIEGAPSFTSNITLLNSSTDLEFGLQVQLNKNIVLNNGTIKLGNYLELGDGVSIGNDGVVKCYNHRLSLPQTEATWTSTLYLAEQPNIRLRNKLNLSGMWIFDDENSTSVINGDGNVLDLSSGGTIWIRSGHSVALSDVTLKGLGGNNSGWILFEDENSTLSLSNVTVVMADSMTVTQGSWYVHGGDSTIITRNHLLTFDQNGTLSVDGVTLLYDTLDTPDNTNIRPFAADGLVHVELNGGQVKAAAESFTDFGLVFDDALMTLARNADIRSDRLLRFRGNSASSITLDGQGFALEVARSTTPLLSVDSGKHAIFKNVLLRDLTAESISHGANSSWTFGDKSIIELGNNTDLKYTWSIDGDVTIDGRGRQLKLDIDNALVLQDGAQLTLRNVDLRGLDSRDSVRTTIKMMGPSVRLVLDNVTFGFDNHFTYSLGTIDCYRDVCFTGTWQNFVYTTSSATTVHKGATWFFDRGMTLSYEPSIASRQLITFEDPTASLHLYGSTLHTTWTGLDISSGRLLVSENSVLKTDARNAAEAPLIASSVKAHILAGASLEMRGVVKYE